MEEPLLDRDEDEDGVPAFDSPARTVSLFHATLALFSTMIGGGMLTLPFATSKVGIMGSLALSFACAALAETTYYLLVVNARQTSSTSYHEVAFKTLGTKGRLASMLCMMGVTIMASMSYLLLIGSLLGEMVFESPTKPERNLISAAFTLFVLFPVSLNGNLAALRYSNLVSALASLLLLFALVYELVREPLKNPDDDDRQVKLIAETWGDLVFGIPFFLTAYTAHFSVISMDQELAQPTLHRARFVTRGSIALAFVLYSLLSVVGYLFALDETCDSILSNIPPRRAVSMVGRIGLTLTLCLSYPLFVLPCRATACELGWTSNTIQFKTRAWMTAVFCSVSLGLCCVIPSVALAFSLTGSTLGIGIGFLLPALFTLGNAKTSAGNWWLACAIAVLAVAGLVVCTASTFSHRNDEPACG
ncbi:hypothetical protein BASA81_010052 [Batrachochytrium salamandrivorans]|nr:hypothetical protein BASA81_010052 [Batrachochytrium salamandrivorans]